MAGTSSRNPFDFDLGKMLGDLQVPGVDMETLLTSQRRNLEAVADANRLAYEGMQAVMQRQTEILRQAIEQANDAASSLVDSNDPQERAARQAQITKEAFERALSSVRELAELSAKSNNEVMNVLNARFSQVMDEISHAIATPAAGGAKGGAKK
ncbi:phasin family protein [Roseospirillum parvum]|uniref:Phasin family protein n=1 Tax=Roseospirillum parvum TaxID=83401 RepID=A0A1G8A094_9PROT|nr:phasin family protein [Roseospirillum parvum]SDH14338.1 phasin family protein [Roseospirillum parvum]